jgi:hypothetical protein
MKGGFEKVLVDLPANLKGGDYMIIPIKLELKMEKTPTGWIFQLSVLTTISC